MAITSTTVTATAGQTEVQIDWSYQTKSSVKAKVDNIDRTVTNVSGSTVTLSDAPAIVAGQTLYVYRDTDVDSIAAEFSVGTALRSQDLNSDFQQLLYSTQEQENEIDKIDGEIIDINNIINNNLNFKSVADVTALNTAAQIPPTDGEGYQVNNTTDITTAANPVVQGLPSDVDWGTGLFCRVIWNTDDGDWDYQSYGANNPDARYNTWTRTGGQPGSLKPTSAGDTVYVVDGNDSPVITLNNDGSAEFDDSITAAGEIKTTNNSGGEVTVYPEGQLWLNIDSAIATLAFAIKPEGGTGQTFGVYKEGTTYIGPNIQLNDGGNPVDVTIELNVDGSITAAGTIQSGGDPNNGINVGCVVAGDQGTIGATAEDGYAVFVGHERGTTEPTCQIDSDGSITAAGDIGLGPYGQFGPGFSGSGLDSNGVLTLYKDYSSSNPNTVKVIDINSAGTDSSGIYSNKISMYADGSINVAGPIGNGEATAGASLGAYGQVVAQRGAGSTIWAGFQTGTGGATSLIYGSGAAKFADDKFDILNTGDTRIGVNNITIDGVATRSKVSIDPGGWMNNVSAVFPPAISIYAPSNADDSKPVWAVYDDTSGGTSSSINVGGDATFAGGITAKAGFYPGNNEGGAAATDLGMYSGATDCLNFATNGIKRLTIDSTGGSTFTANVYAPNLNQYSAALSAIKAAALDNSTDLAGLKAAIVAALANH